MKEINVSIKDQNTLVLEEDASKGDIIDLNKITSIDNSFIASLIENELKNRIEEAKKEAIKHKEEELKNTYLKELNDKELEIQKLNSEITSLNDSKNKDIALKEVEIKEKLDKIHQDELEKLKEEKEKLNTELITLKATQNALVIEEVNKVEMPLKEKISKLEIDNNVLTNSIDEKLALQKAEIENTYNLKIFEKDNLIKTKDEELNRLKLAKSSLGTKGLGEELENWCLNEYETFKVAGFSNCTFEKDNVVIKEEDETNGSKADFIFKVYAENVGIDEELLTSVCLEMKNENNSSVNKKKNSDHYNKLDKDRTKKGCQYALLVSELEWNLDNDAPIRKVEGYKDMYMVRPPYFIVFLSLVNALALKYREIVLETNKANIEFEEKQKIIDTFNSMKSEYLLHTIERIAKSVDVILKNAKDIQVANEKILKEVDEIKNNLIEKYKEKIEKFDVLKITKKMDKAGIGEEKEE